MQLDFDCVSRRLFLKIEEQREDQTASVNSGQRGGEKNISNRSNIFKMSRSCQTQLSPTVFIYLNIWSADWRTHTVWVSGDIIIIIIINRSVEGRLVPRPKPLLADGCRIILDRSSEGQHNVKERWKTERITRPENLAGHQKFKTQLFRAVCKSAKVFLILN